MEVISGHHIGKGRDVHALIRLHDHDRAFIKSPLKSIEPADGGCTHIKIQHPDRRPARRWHQTRIGFATHFPGSMIAQSGRQPGIFPAGHRPPDLGEHQRSIGKKIHAKTPQQDTK